MSPMRIRGIGQGPQPSGELAYLQGRPDTNEVVTNVSPVVRALIDHLSVKLGSTDGRQCDANLDLEARRPRSRLLDALGACPKAHGRIVSGLAENPR